MSADSPVDLVLADAPAELRRLEGRVDALRRQGASVLWELGLALREVQDRALWRAGGYTSFSAWLDERAEISRTTATRTIEVTRQFSRDLAESYGFDKLYAGLRYLSITRRVEQPGDLIALDLRLRIGGRFAKVPFHRASVQQVQDAIALELERKRGISRGGQDDLGARLDRLAAALPAPPKGVRPAQQRVQVTQGNDGKVSLTFKQIPYDELDAFIAALQVMRDGG